MGNLVLLIWEIVSESTQAFLISSLDMKDFNTVVAAHDTYFNRNETEATEFANQLVSAFADGTLDESYPGVKMKLLFDSDGENTTAKPIEIPAACTVVLTGMVL